MINLCRRQAAGLLLAPSWVLTPQTVTVLRLPQQIAQGCALCTACHGGALRSAPFGSHLPACNSLTHAPSAAMLHTASLSSIDSRPASSTPLLQPGAEGTLSVSPLRGFQSVALGLPAQGSRSAATPAMARKYILQPISPQHSHQFARFIPGGTLPYTTAAPPSPPSPVDSQQRNQHTGADDGAAMTSPASSAATSNHRPSADINSSQISSVSNHGSIGAGAASPLGQPGTSSPPGSQQGEGEEETLQAIRARVFELHVGDGRRSGRRPLMKPLVGGWIADWYITPPQHMPLAEDDMEAE